MVALLSSAIVSLLCLRIKREKDSDSPVDDLQKRSILMGNGGSTSTLSTVCSSRISNDVNSSSNRRHESYLTPSRGGLVDQMRMTGSNKNSSGASMETLNSRLPSDKYIHSNQARIP